jgi:hypothetical protein
VASNSGTKLHGKRGAIYINGDITSGIKVSNRTAWNLNLNRDYVDATVFGDLNKTYLTGLRDIQGTYEGLLDTSGDLLLEATSQDTILCYLYADDGSVPVLVAYGPALFDAAVQASNTDAVKVTGNFRASGNWTVAL